MRQVKLLAEFLKIHKFFDELSKDNVPFSSSDGLPLNSGAALANVPLGPNPDI